MSRYTLFLLPVRLAVCQLPPDTAIPPWAVTGNFFSLTRTGDELSIICDEARVPAGVRHTPGWACLEVEGPFDFGVTGVLASLVAPLADAKISCLALATYRTDFLLVQDDHLPAALACLRAAGHTVRDDPGDTDARLAQVARRIHPQAELRRAWTLQGGISAEMTALELFLPGGCTQRVIVRRPSLRTLQQNPQAAADEFRTLQLVRASGIAAPEPYLLDPSGELLPGPYLVMQYVEGQPAYTPPSGSRWPEQMAALLAKIHSISPQISDVSFLPHRSDRLAQVIAQRPDPLDDSLDETRVRAVLEAAWPLPQTNAPALLHGDFWPGNLLWQAGKLVAVVDWEDAAVGEPLADLAITRLDLLWIYGRAAMQEFTRAYQALNPLDFGYLPYWDLVAALRPAGQLAAWAEVWPALGRPDITEATLRAHHRWFVAQALHALGRT